MCSFLHSCPHCTTAADVPVTDPSLSPPLGGGVEFSLHRMSSEREPLSVCVHQTAEAFPEPKVPSPSACRDAVPDPLAGVLRRFDGRLGGLPPLPPSVVGAVVLDSVKKNNQMLKIKGLLRGRKQAFTWLWRNQSN